MKGMAAQGGHRPLWLGCALLATLLAAQWVSGEDGIDLEQHAEQKTMQTETRAAEKEAANVSEQLQLERLERRKFSAQSGDIFRRQSWAPPPPPPSFAKPQPPAPPPLQFKYLGKIMEGEEIRVFLALAERNYVVQSGESINSEYRMDEVSDDTITFTYLPLNAKQMLATAGATDFR